MILGGKPHADALLPNNHVHGRRGKYLSIKTNTERKTWNLKLNTKKTWNKKYRKKTCWNINFPGWRSSGPCPSLLLSLPLCQVTQHWPCHCCHWTSSDYHHFHYHWWLCWCPWISHIIYDATRYRLERSKKKEAIENAHKVTNILLCQPSLGYSEGRAPLPWIQKFWQQIWSKRMSAKISVASMRRLFNQYSQGGGLDEEGDDWASKLWQWWRWRVAGTTRGKVFSKSKSRGKLLSKFYFCPQ